MNDGREQEQTSLLWPVLPVLAGQAAARKLINLKIEQD